MTDETTRQMAEQRQRTMKIGAIAAIVALAGALLMTFGLSRGSNDSSTQLTFGSNESAAAGSGAEVFLEPAQSIGTDPFFADTSALVDVQAVFIPVVARLDVGPESPGDIKTVSGSEPGLYGGTKDNARCNRLMLVEFLETNPDKGAAWAAAQDIDPADIRLFVDTLTPVVLLRDTRVTNHGFVDGRANPIQSVMQAGTAVLVDEGGLPRVRCACGNPLRKPIPQTTVRYSGQAWPTFEAGNVQVVSAGVPSGQLVLQDLEGGAPFARPAGTLGEQDFEAPSAAVAAIKPGIMISGLGDQSLAAAVGGQVTLGTAALAANATNPQNNTEPGATPRPSTTRPLATVAAPIAPQATVAVGAQPTPTMVMEAVIEATATPAPAPTATVAPQPAATATVVVQATATPVPAPTATVAPQPTATTAPQPTATSVPAATAVPTAVPRQIVDLSRQGSVTANSTFSGFSASAVIDGDVSTSWFSTGPGVGPGVLTWNGPRTELTDVAFIGNASHANPDFHSGFGFASVTVEVLDGGSVVYSASGGGEGWSWSPNVVGNSVRLTFTGHQDPACGGFSELIIKGLG